MRVKTSTPDLLLPGQEATSTRAERRANSLSAAADTANAAKTRNSGSISQR
jgi:hypothetical protein